MTWGRLIVNWDHPRVCGEHHVPIWGLHGGQGSPPRMRGAQNKYNNNKNQKGITPAYAGSTFSILVLLSPCGDHPRVCGEHATVR